MRVKREVNARTVVGHSLGRQLGMHTWVDLRVDVGKVLTSLTLLRFKKLTWLLVSSFLRPDFSALYELSA